MNQIPTSSTKKNCIRLVLDVEYAPNGVSIEHLGSNLRSMVERAIGEGMLTDSTESEVEQYSMETRVVDELLTEDQLTAFMVDRIENGDLSAEDIPRRLARYGLTDPRAFSDEMRERMDNAVSEDSVDADPAEAHLLSPFIKATVTCDATAAEVEFDAAAWFAQATEKDIRDLHEISWEGDYAADAVAEHFEKNPDIRRITRRCTGFECHIDPDDAMAWLKVHKTGLWACLLCKDNDIAVIPVNGLWNWCNDDASASNRGLSSMESACMDAVVKLNLSEGVMA